MTSLGVRDLYDQLFVVRESLKRLSSSKDDAWDRQGICLRHSQNRSKKSRGKQCCGIADQRQSHCVVCTYCIVHSIYEVLRRNFVLSEYNRDQDHGTPCETMALLRRIPFDPILYKLARESDLDWETHLKSIIKTLKTIILDLFSDYNCGKTLLYHPQENPTGTLPSQKLYKPSVKNKKKKKVNDTSEELSEEQQHTKTYVTKLKTRLMQLLNYTDAKPTKKSVHFEEPDDENINLDIYMGSIRFMEDILEKEGLNLEEIMYKVPTILSFVIGPLIPLVANRVEYIDGKTPLDMFLLYLRQVLEILLLTKDNHQLDLCVWNDGLYYSILKFIVENKGLQFEPGECVKMTKCTIESANLSHRNNIDYIIRECVSRIYEIYTYDINMLYPSCTGVQCNTSYIPVTFNKIYSTRTVQNELIRDCMSKVLFQMYPVPSLDADKCRTRLKDSWMEDAIVDNTGLYKARKTLEKLFVPNLSVKHKVSFANRVFRDVHQSIYEWTKFRNACLTKLTFFSMIPLVIDNSDIVAGMKRLLRDELEESKRNICELTQDKETCMEYLIENQVKQTDITPNKEQAVPSDYNSTQIHNDFMTQSKRGEESLDSVLLEINTLVLNGMYDAYLADSTVVCKCIPCIHISKTQGVFYSNPCAITNMVVHLSTALENTFITKVYNYADKWKQSYQIAETLYSMKTSFQGAKTFVLVMDKYLRKRKQHISDTMSTFTLTVSAEHLLNQSEDHFSKASTFGDNFQLFLESFLTTIKYLQTLNLVVDSVGGMSRLIKESTSGKLYTVMKMCKEDIRLGGVLTNGGGTENNTPVDPDIVMGIGEFQLEVNTYLDIWHKLVIKYTDSNEGTTRNVSVLDHVAKERYQSGYKIFFERVLPNLINIYAKEYQKRISNLIDTKRNSQSDIWEIEYNPDLWISSMKCRSALYSDMLGDIFSYVDPNSTNTWTTKLLGIEKLDFYSEFDKTIIGSENKYRAVSYVDTFSELHNNYIYPNLIAYGALDIKKWLDKVILPEISNVCEALHIAITHQPTESSSLVEKSDTTTLEARLKVDSFVRSVASYEDARQKVVVNLFKSVKTEYKTSSELEEKALLELEKFKDNREIARYLYLYATAIFNCITFLCFLHPSDISIVQNEKFVVENWWKEHLLGLLGSYLSMYRINADYVWSLESLFKIRFPRGDVDTVSSHLWNSRGIKEGEPFTEHGADLLTLTSSDWRDMCIHNFNFSMDRVIQKV